MVKKRTANPCGFVAVKSGITRTFGCHCGQYTEPFIVAYAFERIERASGFVGLSN